VNWIDLTLLVVLLLFGLRGYFRGLFREVFSLVGLVAGFIGAARYAEPVARHFEGYWNAPPIVFKGVVFMICFFVIYVLCNLTGWLLHRSARVLFLQTLNRVGGVVLGVGKGTALAALAVFAMTSTTAMPRSAREKLDNAYLVSPLSHLADNLIRFGKTKIFVKEYSEARAAAGSRRAERQT
jgi:membrane protein required for colicin V production